MPLKKAAKVLKQKQYQFGITKIVATSKIKLICHSFHMVSSRKTKPQNTMAQMHISPILSDKELIIFGFPTHYFVCKWSH